MSDHLALRRGALVALAVAAAGLLLAITGVNLVVAGSWGARVSAFWETGWIGFCVVGAVLVHRRPREPIGRLLVLIGFFTALTFAGAGYANHDLGADHRVGLLGTAAALAYSPAFAISFAGVIATVLTYPTGRLETRLRRIGVRMTMVATAAVVAGYLLRPRQQLHEGAWISNPLHPRWLGTAPNTLIAAGVFALLGLSVVAILGAVRTFRRSTGIVRQQMRWFARAALVLPSLFVCGVLLGAVAQPAGDWVCFAGIVTGLNAIAVAIGVAVMRYRLYDIDRLVSRTLSYAVVTGVVVGFYVGAVAVTQAVVGFSSSAAVAASTLAAAAAFQPLRRRVQRGVDRRFDRAAYDARHTVEAFSQRLRDEVDVDAVRRDLLSTVGQAVAPHQVSLWVAS